MLGGTFDLDSQPGGPTTLSFTLPRVQPEEIDRGSARSCAALPSIPPAPRSSNNVLPMVSIVRPTLRDG